MSNYQQTNEGIVEQTPFGSIHHNLSDLMPASSEVGFLWSSYLAANMSTCFLKKWVAEATDPEIKDALQLELDAASKANQDIEVIFKSINYPIPVGFGEKDVDINAPPLFSQSFYLLYTRMTQRMLLQQLSAAATSSYRSDFQDFFHSNLKTAADRHRRSTEILLAKGILQKHPSIVRPRDIQTVTDKDYLGTYLGIMGDKRPLTAMEISQIYTIMEIKQIIRTYHVGSSQVVRSEKVRKYLLKAREIADKQLNELHEILFREDVPRPSLSEILITDSKEPGISDRLILTHSTAVTTFIGISYGQAISTMVRKDLGTTMIKFLGEVLGLAKDGAELLIELGWLEKMPETANRKELTH